MDNYYVRSYTMLFQVIQQIYEESIITLYFVDKKIDIWEIVAYSGTFS